MNKYGTILIVDDNASILTAMRYLLDETFEQVLTTTQPEDILKLMAQQTIDLVLLDMPPVDIVADPLAVRKLKDVLDMKNEIVSLDEMEKDHIRRTIDHCHGNLTQAAELLGITRQTLYNKMRRL